MNIDEKKLIKALIDSKLLTEDEIVKAGNIADKQQVPLTTVIFEKKLAPEKRLAQIISDLLSIPFIDLKSIKIPEEVIKTLSEREARQYHVVIFAVDEQGIKIAMEDPTDTKTIQTVQHILNKKLIVYYATHEGIEEAYNFYQQKIIATINEVIKKSLEKEVGKKKFHDLPIVTILDVLLAFAYRNRVSDIHIEAFGDNVLVRFRIDGILHDIILLPKSFHQQLINRIKVISKIRTYEEGKPQDGRFRFLFQGLPTDVRVSIIPTIEGEKAVLRYLSTKSREYELEDIGLEDINLVKVRRNFQKPHGMILVTGPTGSGKTTTLYSILKKLNRREVNISTIEDPVEYRMQGINQIQIDPLKGVSFANGLRALLRQDPNILLVGEIRDNETADIAINAALTGHLVLSTLHTNDAPTSLPRLIDMKIEPFLIASTINVIIAQRLVRKTCPYCQTSYELEKDFLSAHLPEEIVNKRFKKSQLIFYKGMGCQACQGTGYIGRVGIFEVLELDKEVQRAIVDRKDANQIKQIACEHGMKTMIENGFDKVERGITTMEEILRVAKE